MRLFAILFTLLAACGGGTKSSPAPVSNTTPTPTEPPPAPPPDRINDVSCAEDPALAASVDCAVHTVDRFARQMCECKDKACAEKTNDDFTKWGTEMAKSTKGDEPKPSAEQVQHITDAATKYTECFTKLASS